MFKQIAPEYANEDDATIAVFIDLAAQRLGGPLVWGAVYTQAVAYLAAHLLAVSRAGVDGSGGTSAEVTSKRTGDLAVGYASSGIGGDDAALAATRFGKEFLALRSTRAVGRASVIRPR